MHRGAEGVLMVMILVGWAGSSIAAVLVFGYAAHKLEHG